MAQRNEVENDMQTQMLIGGQMVAGTEREEQVLNPRTGEVILTLPEASLAQVEQAVAAATAAFDGWSKTTPAQRSNYLLKIADRIEAASEEFAALAGRFQVPLAQVQGLRQLVSASHQLNGGPPPALEPLEDWSAPAIEAALLNLQNI